MMVSTTPAYHTEPKSKKEEKKTGLDFLDNLINEALSTKKPEPQRPPVSRLKLPDALVLLLLTTRCSSCGSTFGPVPNDTILYRFGTNLHFPTQWSDAFASVPRELIPWEKVVPYCGFCLHTFPFSHLNMGEKKNDNRSR